MKKTICITPIDDDMEVMAKSVDLLNKFKVFGVAIRKDFVDMVISVDAGFSTREKIQELYSFWLGRSRDRKLNESLEKVLQHLAEKLQDKIDILNS